MPHPSTALSLYLPGVAGWGRGPGKCFRAVANLHLQVLHPLPTDLWSLSLFPFQLARRGNKGRAGRPWAALQMPSELVILALMLIQGALGAARSLQTGAQLCPPEVNPSLQPAAQISMSSPQPWGPQEHQKVQLPTETPPYIILGVAAVTGCQISRQ